MARNYRKIFVDQRILAGVADEAPRQQTHFCSGIETWLWAEPNGISPDLLDPLYYTIYLYLYHQTRATWFT